MKPRILQLAILCTVTAVCSAADRITTADGNSLSGTVSEIGPDGRIIIESENATAPLAIKQDALQSVLFDSEEHSGQNHSEILELSNGDTLPGTFAELDGEVIGYNTSYAGKLTIPRSSAHSVDFGIAPQPLVFQGPGKISEWEDNNDWQSAGATLISTGSADIRRPGILPKQFILHFRFEWEGTPSFRFYFCDDHLKIQGDADRYYFEINSAGIQLKRQRKSSHHEESKWASVASLPAKPQSFPESKIDIELRVDRTQEIIHFYINEESQGFYREPYGSFPAGTGILLQSLVLGGSKNIVSNIKIYEWDAISQLRRSEGHEDLSNDAVISSTGERFSGTAEKLVTKSKGSEGILFASPHSDESFVIPRNRISTLYFQRQPATKSTTNTHCVYLADSGKLHLSHLTLADGKLAATHSLLGKISVNRDALLRIDKLSDPRSDADEENDTP